MLGWEEASLRIKNILDHPLAEWLDFSQESVIAATELARERRIRVNDALIAQQAIQNNAAILTDNIKDFKKIKSLKLIPLGEPQ